jgi:putative lipoic acid-binding regulatory protein
MRIRSSSSPAIAMANDKPKPKPKPDLTGLKAALDKAVVFPTVYTFKFIVPRSQVNHLIALMDGHRYTQRESSAGRFVGLTFEAMMTSSDDIVAVYERAATVDGILSF